VTNADGAVSPAALHRGPALSAESQRPNSERPGRVGRLEVFASTRAAFLPTAPGAARGGAARRLLFRRRLSAPTSVWRRRRARSCSSALAESAA
jgi:hypothetical protein